MRPYYEHNGITIYHGDCREVLGCLAVAFCRACRCELADEGVLAIHLASGHDVGPLSDICLTDPPYGLNIAANPFRQKFDAAEWDAEPIDKKSLELLLKLGRDQVIWGGNYFPLPPTKCFLVWDKCQPEDFSSAMCEQAWTTLDSPAKLFRYRVVDYEKFHPTQKPLELMLWCLKFFPHDSAVIDPYMGVGTTLRAAKDTGRRAIGIEIEEKYCELSAKRLSQEVFQFQQETVIP